MITVRLYNYAGVPFEILAKAQKQAEKIFQRLGAQMIWVDCPFSMERYQDYPACHQDMGPTDFVIGVLPRFRIQALGLHNSSLGFAYPENRIAHVSLQRVKHLAQFGYASQAEILGHAVAHELGHLLLSSNLHSSSGLMRADWDWKDLRSMAAGKLLFSLQQGELIKDRLRRWVGQQSCDGRRAALKSSAANIR